MLHEPGALGVGAVPENRALDAKTLLEDHAEVGVRPAAAGQPHDDGPSPGRHGAHDLGEERASHEIDGRVRTVLRCRPDLVGEPQRRGRQPEVHAQLPGQLKLPRGPADADALAAPSLDELQGGRADAAADGRHDHPFVCCHLQLEHGVVGRQERLGNGGRHLERPPRRHTDRVRRRNDHVLGVRPAAGDPHDRVPESHGVGARPERLHLAGELQSGDVPRRTLRRGVHTTAMKQVRPVDADGSDAYPDLPWPGIGKGNVLDGKDVGAARFHDDDSAHVGPAI